MCIGVQARCSYDPLKLLALSDERNIASDAKKNISSQLSFLCQVTVGIEVQDLDVKILKFGQRPPTAHGGDFH